MKVGEMNPSNYVFRERLNLLSKKSNKESSFGIGWVN